MFKNKGKDGALNLCGHNVMKYRKERKISQRILAEQLQLGGLDVNKNAIQQIECGSRFVTDIELVALAKVFGVSVDTLLG